MKLGEEREGTWGGVGLKGIPQLFFIFLFLGGNRLAE